MVGIKCQQLMIVHLNLTAGIREIKPVSSQGRIQVATYFKIQLEIASRTRSVCSLRWVLSPFQIKSLFDPQWRIDKPFAQIGVVTHLNPNTVNANTVGLRGL